MKRIPIVPILTLAVLGLDQFAKWLVVNNIQPGQSIPPVPFLSSVFVFTNVANAGIAFGLFKEAGTFFIFLAVVVITIIVLFLRHLPKDQRLVRIALGLQLGGAFGNLVDRMRLGHVIDFVDFKFLPVFNLADLAIVVGVTLLAVSFWREGRAPTADAAGNRLPG